MGSATASHSRGHQQNGRRRARREAEHIRVEIRLEENHRHEDEVRGGIGGAVARLFEEGELLVLIRHMTLTLSGWCQPGYSTVKITFCKSLSREELPTMISNSPGSTTYFMWRS